MPAAIVSYFEKLWNRLNGNGCYSYFNDRNRLHGHGYVPGRP